MTIQPTPTGAPANAEDPNSPEVLADPVAYYERMRASAPVVWLEKLGVWAVFRDDLCREVLGDWKNFGSSGGAGFANFYKEKPWREPSVVFEVDPPDHTRTRRVLSRVLSPRTVRDMDATAAVEAQAFVAQAVSKGTFDVVGDLARPYALKILPDALGLSPHERENMLIYRKYLVKGRSLHRNLPWPKEELEEAAWVVEWVKKTCSRDQVSPDGLGSQIYAAVDAGEVSEHEGNMLIRSFLSAGTDTTYTMIGNTILFLLQNPSQWEMLKADPARARNAFEEALRFGSTTRAIARTVMDDMEFHGAKLGKYDKILAYVASANRDPARWENPNTFMIERNVTGHLGLGFGIHGCVGQMIARLEASHIVAELARQAPTVTFAETPPVMAKSGNGVERLPVIVPAS
jgi:cytochrome P450